MATRAEPWVLGVNTSHHGSACLLKGSKLVAAIQEERLTRIKRAELNPAFLESLAVRYCLEAAGIRLTHVDRIVVATKGSLSAQESARNLKDSPVPPDRIDFVPHYLAHAWSAWATSGYDNAAILVADGLGESLDSLNRYFPVEATAAKEAVIASRTPIPNALKGETVGIYRADRNGIELIEKHIGSWLIPGPGMRQFGSLGGMFSAAAKLMFDEALDAGKVMGLAPYGNPRYPIEHFLSIDDAGVFHFRNEAVRQFAQPRDSWPSHQSDYADLACSVQRALEYALLYLLEHAGKLSSSRNFAFAGGVALNSVANEKLIRRGIFSHHYFVPAAEDSGLAIGAAFHGLHAMVKPRATVRLKRDSPGISYSANDIRAAAAGMPAGAVEISAEYHDTVAPAVEALIDGAAIGWFEGGSEFGPRALGQRSILADPRSAVAKDRLNAKVKHRESFRPFAPVILLEELGKWFDVIGPDVESPFMMRVVRFKPTVCQKVPAVTHIDGTGRVQTVTRETHPRLHDCLTVFGEQTGVPMLLNTSFNVLGEPIVETPEDAMWSLLFSDLDAIVFERHIVTKHPAFGSILDYRYLAAIDINESYRDCGGGMRVYDSAPQRPWGKRPVRLDRDTETIMNMCGEASSGRQLLDDLRAASAPREWTELRLRRGLARLVRADLVKVH